MTDILKNRYDVTTATRSIALVRSQAVSSRIFTKDEIFLSTPFYDTQLVGFCFVFSSAG